MSPRRVKPSGSLFLDPPNNKQAIAFLISKGGYQNRMVSVEIHTHTQHMRHGTHAHTYISTHTHACMHTSAYTHVHPQLVTCATCNISMQCGLLCLPCWAAKGATGGEPPYISEGETNWIWAQLPPPSLMGPSCNQGLPICEVASPTRWVGLGCS